MLLRAAVNAVRKHRGQEPLDAVGFLKMVREKAPTVDLAVYDVLMPELAGAVQ